MGDGTQSEITTHYRACNLCEALCGLAITVAGGRIQTIKGDAQDPFSRGHICPKAVAYQDLQDDPDRLRSPMRRVGDTWHAVSWDEALDETADRLVEIVRSHGADAIASYQGNPNVHNYGLMTHANALLSPIRSKNRFSATSVDQLPHQLIVYWMYGHSLLVPIPDLDHTDYFLVLGANPLASNGSLMTVPDVAKRLSALKARGGKLVVLDPRRTETAELADRHHFIRPETDATLLLALLHVIFAEGLDNPAHLTPFLKGWDAIPAIAAPYTPERAAGITGLDADTIRQLARDFATAERAVIYGRMGISVQRHGTLCQWLIQLLMIATGNLDRVGGALVTKPAVDVVQSSRGGGYDRWRSRVSGLPEALGELPVAALAEEILTDGPGQVRALITLAGNPALSTPNGQQMKRALASLDFMVSLDLYRNETTRHAHIILPTTTALEHDHYDMIFNIFAVRNVARYNQPVFPKPEGTRHDWEICADLGRRLAERLGQTVRPTPAPDQIIDAALRTGPYGADHAMALSLDRLKDRPHGIDLGPLSPSFPDRLTHPDHLIVCAPPAMLAAIAAAEESLLAPRSDQLVLIGRRDLRSNNSWMHNAPRLVKGKDRCRLLMHPTDAARLSLSSESRVHIQSRVGSVETLLTISDSVMEGVVCLPHGWGHVDRETHLAVAKTVAGVNINDLTDDRRLDPVCGNAGLNGVPVAVTATPIPA